METAFTFFKATHHLRNHNGLNHRPLLTKTVIRIGQLPYFSFKSGATNAVCQFHKICNDKI